MGVCLQGNFIEGGQTPPEIHGILQDMVNKRVVRILLECILVLFTFPKVFFYFPFWKKIKQVPLLLLLFNFPLEFQCDKV